MNKLRACGFSFFVKCSCDNSANEQCFYRREDCLNIMLYFIKHYIKQHKKFIDRFRFMSTSLLILTDISNKHHGKNEIIVNILNMKKTELNLLSYSYIKYERKL